MSFFKALLFIASFVFSLGIVNAQDIQSMVGDSPFSTSFEGEALFAGEVKESLLTLGHQFKKKDNHRVGVSGRYFELKNNLKNIPQFYNLSFGASYKYYLEDQKSLGFTGSFGSASDKLFKDSRDSNISANVLYRKSEKWIFLANYSNNRAFLNNIPLPGFIYVHHQSREKMILLGLPFLYVQMPFADGKFSVRYVGLVPYNHKLRLVYNDLALFRPFISVEQGPLVFFDSSRANDRERTFWFERKASFGLEKSYGPLLKIDMQIGRAFDREYYQARSISQKHSNVQKIDDATFVSINLKSNF